MSKNPLETVTQAVNSLLTALKLPDESSQANQILGEMSFPQFSRLLPYRDYNQESGLFMNDTTMGFMLEAIPINGANKSIVEALDHMLRTKLPRGIPLCIHLMSSQLVGDRIEYGLREFSWSGEQAERFNAITRAYYMKAAATQFPLPEGMNLPLTLRHYRVFISYCSPSKKKSRADILEMENLVKIIRASLQGASITTQTVDAQAFIDIVGEMINHNPDSLYPKRRQLDPYSDLNYQCVEDSFDLKVRADYLTLGLRENGRNSTARILNFHLARNLDEVHEGLLLQAVRASWLAKENRARIDDVVDFLKNASDSEQYAGSPTIRSRLDEMIVLLDQYTANGTYGQYFNSDEPSLRDDAKMVVLELGGLEDRPSLLVAVMFSLIIYIENRMYRTPRNLKKLNVIDEGWRLLDFKNRKVGEFIEKGYRTARRHTGAYITITQNIVDFDSDKASSAARAAWGNSSYKIILKQSAKEFAKYNQLYAKIQTARRSGSQNG
ncbi:TraC family protein [Escherichia coli]|uniref:TraC family protein n=1 Tax=Escherichia coli TaxID=562 RepID=UPI000E01DB1B|nr:TraC family protein [Escherichia coli]STK42479.1 conjugal transfer ATP-binding protein TraC [Escherichia coli]